MSDLSRVADPSQRVGLPTAWTGPARAVVGAGTFGVAVRPWNWLELDAGDAEKVWEFLVGFVAFFNARYGERPDRRIPPCWVEHGPIVEELTTLAFARWHAFESSHASIGGAQYWHSYTLPSFFDRLATWLGSGLISCQQGHHRDLEDRALDTAASWIGRSEVVRGLDLIERAELTGDLDRQLGITEVEFLNRDVLERLRVRPDGSIVPGDRSRPEDARPSSGDF